MKTNFLRSVWLLLLTPLWGFTQNNATLPNVIPSSPEVASILRYSEVPVSYFNGIPNINIPLCELEGRELSVPVSLSYHAGGHRVNEEASWVGLGWNLIAGGQITRTVRGIPDEHSKGYIRTGKTIDYVNGVCNNSNSIQECGQLTNYQLRRNLIDLEPDDFSYNMMGRSGRFMFNQNRSSQYPFGEVVQFEGLNVKIETNALLSSWTFTTTDGTRYVFVQGNKLNNITKGVIEGSQASIQANDGFDQPQEYENYYETWNLRHVFTPNGDHIEFKYATDNAIDNSLISHTLTVSDPIDGVGDPFSGGGNTETTFINYSRTNRTQTYLTEIISSKGRIKFIRDDNERPDVQGSRKRLQKIEVYGGFSKIKEIEFFHQYDDSNIPNNFFISEYHVLQGTPSEIENALTKRLYLDGLLFKGLIDEQPSGRQFSYDFNYNFGLPFKWSNAQDHWGYYNGANNANMIPFQHQGYNAADRTPNSSYSDAGMLTSIRYPEGGTTAFTYENNEREVNHGFGNITYEPSGGLRIKQISNSEGQRRRYTYSGGFQVSKPFYIEYNSGSSFSVSSVSSIPLATTQSGYVGYKKVIERVDSGDNSTNNRYTIEREYNGGGGVSPQFPDIPYVNNNSSSLLKREVNDVTETEYIYGGFETLYPLSLPGNRGVRGIKLATRLVFSDATTLQDLSGTVSAIGYINCEQTNTCPISQYYLPSTQFLPSKTTVNVIKPGEEMTTVTETFYEGTENHYNPTRTVTTNSEGRTLETKYFYTGDTSALSGLNTNAINGLTNKHQQDVLIEAQQFENGTLVNKQRTNFGVFNGDTNTSNSDNFLPNNILTARLNDNWDSRVNYLSYTRYGQPQEVTLEDGSHVVYLWDSQFNYPTAKIENATLNEVNYAIATHGGIHSVRSNNGLPNAMIYTYSYKPMVGITSMTDPRGYYTSYSYDDFNRLEFVKDADGHVLSRNRYHYKN